MRAKLINEGVNFERGLDPKTMMGIGNDEIRDMNDSLKAIQELFKSGFDNDNLSFTEIVNHIDSLKDAVDYTLKNHIKKKYGWDLKRDLIPEGSLMRAFSVMLKRDNGEDLYVIIKKSSTSRTFTLEAFGKYTYTASMNMRSLDKKIDDMIKKFNIKRS